MPSEARTHRRDTVVAQVENVLELLAAGMTIEEIIDDHQDLEFSRPYR